MKGLEAIKEQILNDAKAESEKTLETARTRAEEKKVSRLAAEKKVLAATLKHNEEEANRRKERMLTTAKLEARKNELFTKQEMIEQAFDNVSETFRAMDRQKYARLMAQIMLHHVETGEETVVVSSNDVDVLNEQFIGQINQELKEAGKPGNLRLSGDQGAFSGGFVLVGTNAETNCSIESLIRQVRKRLESDVAGILFD